MLFDKKGFGDFLGKFRFQPARAGYMGVEQERFLVYPDGKFAPEAFEFLRSINDERWTQELSACQVESRTRPQCDLAALKLELLENENNGKAVAAGMGLDMVNCEVGAESMPLDVFPNERYRRIVQTISIDRLRAACRVAGTHIHIGFADMDRAIAAYNAFIPHLDELAGLGDHSGGERLRLYKTMAEHWKPMPYKSAKHFFRVASLGGFAENPRNCWQLIRVSIHGTVELRMFGAAVHADEVVSWASRAREILAQKGVGYA